MPGGDGKGPMGQGPLTGRGLGICGGKSQSSPAAPSQESTAVQGTPFINRIARLWQGRRKGGGQGFGGGRGRNRG